MMRTHPLVVVRATRRYAVPPVCSAQWTDADWHRTSTVTIEPLSIQSLGATWTATGERNAHGDLLYRQATQ